MSDLAMTTSVSFGLPVETSSQAGDLGRNPAAVYLAGLSEGSRRTMRQKLHKITLILFHSDYGQVFVQEYGRSGGDVIKLLNDDEADVEKFPWVNLRYEHTSLIRSALMDQCRRPGTANCALSALRQVLKKAWLLEQIGERAYRKAISVENIDNETLPAGRSITRGELQALMDTCAADPGAAGVRDAAIIALLYSCGLRVGELCGLDLADYNHETGELTIRKAKRNKQRLAHVLNGAAEALADWLILRGEEAGALFYPVRKGGHIWPGRLTSQAVYHLLQKRAEQAGVKSLSPHDFRRTFVGDLLDAGADLSTVQKLAGHASPTTTARYDRRPEAAKRRAVSLLHVPYQRRTLALG